MLATSAIAADLSTEELQCRSGGVFVLASLHQLNACTLYNKIQNKPALEIKTLIYKNYPKIQIELESGSSLSNSAKELVDGTPFDFNNNQNSLILEHICEGTIVNLQSFTASKEWLKGLYCWQ